MFYCDQQQKIMGGLQEKWPLKVWGRENVNNSKHFSLKDESSLLMPVPQVP